MKYDLDKVKFNDIHVTKCIEINQRFLVVYYQFKFDPIFKYIKFY